MKSKTFKFQKNKQYYLKIDDKKQKTMICFLSRTAFELTNNCLSKHQTIDLLKPFKVIDLFKNNDKGTVNLRVSQGKTSGWFKTIETGETINWNEYISSRKD